MADQTVETVTQQNQETVTKQKNPLRIEQGQKLVEYNRCKKEELKRLNYQITKQDDIAKYKPRTDSNNYVLMSSMAWVKRCFSEKSKNLNKLLVFEALYP